MHREGAVDEQGMGEEGALDEQGMGAEGDHRGTRHVYRGRGS